MSKTSKDKAYERGVQDGLKGGFLDDMCHGFGKVLNMSENDEIYDKGYKWGVEHRYDKPEKK